MRASLVTVQVAIAKLEAEDCPHLNVAGVAAVHPIELSEIRIARSQIVRDVGQSRLVMFTLLIFPGVYWGWLNPLKKSARNCSFTAR